MGIGVFSLRKSGMLCILCLFPLPGSCGIFVYRLALATSKETREASSGRFLLSMKLCP